MKSAARCDTQSELQNFVSLQILERTLRLLVFQQARLYQCQFIKSLSLIYSARNHEWELGEILAQRFDFGFPFASRLKSMWKVEKNNSFSFEFDFVITLSPPRTTRYMDRRQSKTSKLTRPQGFFLLLVCFRFELFVSA